ncbi:MAG: hypothetical protein HY010_10630 [Acidobacteria bacterium]|nr:hypothetical protein [Acidobacteriota bacterium]
MNPVKTLVFLMLALPLYAQTADELVARNLVARGGAEKLRSIKTMTMIGTISFGDASSPLTVKVRRPSQIREDFKINGGDITRSYDGSSGWEVQGGKTRQLEGGELNNIREEAENAIEGPLLDYARKGSRIEALGKADIDGKAVYKLKIMTTLGTSITQFLDAASYLEIHEEIERSANGKLMIIVEDVGDYREVDGVKFAHRFVSGSRENPTASTLQIEKMQLNVPVDAEVFAPPRK